MNVEELLKAMVEKESSDLFITVGIPPAIKSNEKFSSLTESPLTEKEAEKLIFSLMSDQQLKQFKETKEMNFAIFRENLGRFRVSAFFQRLQVGAVLRHIKTEIPTLETLHMPKVLERFSTIKQGLAIIVGAAGVGKSSTLAAMMGCRNQMMSGHIVTIEDPIEFVHEHQKSIITQREVGIDTESFESALKNTLRQAPDVILIGEIRNRETMNYALAFSETGHLCLSTLHASNAYQALDRIASFSPLDSRDQLWLDLSLNLKVIIAQRLIPTIAGGRIPAVEIMVNTPTITELIRKGNIHEIKQYMLRTNEYGMQTMDQSILKLFEAGVISEEDALKYAESENELRLAIKLKKGKEKNPAQHLTMLGDQDD